MTKQTLAIIGGTGAEGLGLAQRYARAGHPVIIGSRETARAEAAADSLRSGIEGATVSGAENAAAARDADIAIIAVPYEAQRVTLEALRMELAGKIVIDTVNPLEFRDRRPRAMIVPEGSAAEQAQAILPESKVVGAFHHLSAPKLAGEQSLDADVLVFGEDAEAKATVMALVAEVPGLRPVEAGGLNVAHAVEGFTAVMLSVNRSNKALTAIRLVGLQS